MSCRAARVRAVVAEAAWRRSRSSSWRPRATPAPATTRPRHERPPGAGRFLLRVLLAVRLHREPPGGGPGAAHRPAAPVASHPAGPHLQADGAGPADTAPDEG